MSNKYKFNDLVIPKVGFLRGPFGGDLKKEIFVDKGPDTYKVYEQGVVLNSDKSLGNYYISKKHYDEKLNKFSVQDKDFLVSCSGVNLGAVYQLKSPFEKGIINQALLRIRLNGELLDDYYFYYLFKELISKKITRGTGDSTIPNFPPLDYIKKIEIEIPDKINQEKIGKILVALDNKISLNKRINSELEQMAKTLYNYWFVQFDFPNEQGKPYKSSGGKMEYNNELKREIPKGWEVGVLNNLINILDSKRIPLSNQQRANKKGIFPYYGATEIMDYIDEYIFDGTYVLMAEDGSVMNKNGNPVLQYIWGKSWINNHAHVLEGKGSISNEYLHLMLKNISVIQIMSGSIQKKINQENLKKTPIQIVPNIYLKKLDDIIIPIYSKLKLIYEENQELIRLRDFLLPLLMNGQVKVK